MQGVQGVEGRSHSGQDDLIEISPIEAANDLGEPAGHRLQGIQRCTQSRRLGENVSHIRSFDDFAWRAHHQCLETSPIPLGARRILQ